MRLIHRQRKPVVNSMQAMAGDIASLLSRGRVYLFNCLIPFTLKFLTAKPCSFSTRRQEPDGEWFKADHLADQDAAVSWENLRGSVMYFLEKWETKKIRRVTSVRNETVVIE